MRSMMPSDAGEPLRDEHAEESYASGGLVNGSPDPSEERRPRVRRRKPPVTDGPFAETKELFGGWVPPGSMRR